MRGLGFRWLKFLRAGFPQGLSGAGIKAKNQLSPSKPYTTNASETGLTSVKPGFRQGDTMLAGETDLPLRMRTLLAGNAR